MGLAEDIQSFKSNWSTLSAMSRIVFCLSIFLSCLSIASIADGVYQFKGFMAEAVVFWHLITTPVILLMQKLIPNIKTWQFDFWAISLLAFTPYMTASWGMFSKLRKIIYAVSLASYPFFPFVYSQEISIIAISVLYFFVLIIILIPPFNQRYITIAVRMALPPLFVAVLAGVAEGVGKPLV